MRRRAEEPKGESTPRRTTTLWRNASAPAADREALGVLYDRYASLCLAAALRVVADREVAEDLVHDTFVAVWRKIDKFDPRRGSLRSWLLTVVPQPRDRPRAGRAPDHRGG